MDIEELMGIDPVSAELIAMEMDKVARMNGIYNFEKLLEHIREEFTGIDREFAIALMGIGIGMMMQAEKEMRRDECINNSKHN